MTEHELAERIRLAVRHEPWVTRATTGPADGARDGGICVVTTEDQHFDVVVIERISSGHSGWPESIIEVAVG